MALSYGFYNALHTGSGYDKIYQSGEMSKLFDGLIVDGVYLSSREGDSANQQFMVTANTNNMKVRVAPGRAWFVGTYTVSDEYEFLDIDAADSYDRIDAIVIEVNKIITQYDDPTDPTERFNSIKVVKGTAAEEPEKPEMAHEGGIDQYPIAYITVSADTSAIRPYDIEYVVGSETPYFAWLGENLSIAELYSKWKSSLEIVTMPFETWLASMERMIGFGDEDYDNIVQEINTISDTVYISGIRPKVDETEADFNGDGETTEFTIEVSEGTIIKSIADIFVDGNIVHGYTFDHDTNTVTLESAPAIGTNNVVVYYIVKADTYTLFF